MLCLLPFAYRSCSPSSNLSIDKPTSRFKVTKSTQNSKIHLLTIHRLAPENPYPAAVQDSWEALLWLQSTAASLLCLDLTKVAIGGSSAGGNLAAIMCHKALSAPSIVPKFVAQLLIVPVTDNTADTKNTVSWRENEFTPVLPALKMLW